MKATKKRRNHLLLKGAEMASSTFAAPLFLALAVIFLGVTLRNVLVEEGKLTPARKTWLRVAFIFAVVAIVLQLVHAFAR